MGKQLIHAVAGSGKTTKILNEISSGRRSLVITYTGENLRSIEASVISEFGHMPEFVHVRSYFSFLYSFCIRPYFSYFLRDKSYTWGQPSKRAQRTPKSELGHYMSSGRYLYANRAAKLILEFGVLETIQKRIARHFDNFLVDEVQDFAANDFNLLLGLVGTDANMMFVGDYHQHTYDTSRDGNTRTSLHKKGVGPYLAEFEKAGLDVDLSTLRKSYRCSPELCSFISQNLGVPIESHRKDSTSVQMISNRGRVREILHDDTIVKLFYQKHESYDCFSNNWGLSKGLNSYVDVCVFLNKKTAEFLKAGKANELPAATRNKLYVACSRARGNLYLIEEELLKAL